MSYTTILKHYDIEMLDSGSIEKLVCFVESNKGLLYPNKLSGELGLPAEVVNKALLVLSVETDDVKHCIVPKVKGDLLEQYLSVGFSYDRYDEVVDEEMDDTPIPRNEITLISTYLRSE
ncbi:hypothetical protein ACRXCV_12990 [Halobacteriovorax sp. GFR7]|uniref:hypothetical protein n=1 Tax=unclassified Halobacteriovorax TaxID=2639665 RepID=UPI003D9738D2